MEFFEKAHVRKSKNSRRKDGKSDEAVKKQLKQMLYGYQHSDNTIIKDSAHAKHDLEDSSSVSGYSDLNISEPSLALDNSQETADTEREESDKNDLTLNDSLTSINMESIISSKSLSSTSISQHENTHSFTQDQKLDEMLENESSDSFIVTSTDFDSNSENESDFDPDGALAEKIMERIKETKNEKKCKKRKFRDENFEISNVYIVDSEYKGPYRPEVDSDLSQNMASISLPRTKEFPGPFRPTDIQTDESTSTSEADTYHSTEDNSLHSSAPSSPFVSVLATDMENENLTDILGQYTYPTIRNMPTDSNNILPNSSDIFEIENASVVDMETEEDVCSLIPEVDNDPAVEEIELEMAASEPSVEPLEENPTFENENKTNEILERDLSPNLVDAPLLNPVRVYYGKNNQCIFVLKHPTDMYIHGKVKIKALGGSIEVFGYLLQDQPQEIYAPNYNFAQYIRTKDNHTAYYGLFGKLTSSGLSVVEAEDIVTSIGEFDGVLSLQPLKSKKIDFVENNFSATDLFSKPSKNIENYFKKASELLGCSLYLSKPWKKFELSPTWQNAIQSGLNNHSRGVICGGKGVGKSTFLRYYVNRLLPESPVLVIDLDPGQCEFTVAGNVSATIVTQPLLGPNFTHLKTPELMLNIGMINTMDNLRRYVSAVETLLTHCANHPKLSSLPWIVNTMGMTNTVGLKLMTLIIIQTQPTFLVQLDSNISKKRYDYHLYPQTVKNLYFEDYMTDYLFRNVKEVNIDYTFVLSPHADSGVKKNFSLHPREERYLNYLAYFGELLNTRSDTLLGVVPYQVKLKDIKIGLNVKIDTRTVTEVINGKVVALCADAADCSHVFTIRDSPLRCLGAGLIRGIDSEKGILYVVTPEPGARLAAAECLVYADWAPELRGATVAQRVPPGRPLPYRTAADYDQRELMFTPKRRFNPLQLLKMSRKT